MKSFVLVYQRSSGLLRQFREHADRQQALADFFAQEMAAKDDSDLEVVVLAGESREALERTHARYFHTLSEIVGTALSRAPTA